VEHVANLENRTHMKFDAARVTGLINKLCEPPYQGWDGESNVAAFVAEQFQQMGMAVERRDVAGSRFPQRVAPWVGWLVYGTLVTTSYLMLIRIDRIFEGLAIALIFVGYSWLLAMLYNWVRLGRRWPRLETAPLILASFPSTCRPPARVVFQVVLGGLKSDFFRSFRLNGLSVAMGLQSLFLMGALSRLGSRAGAIPLLPIDSIVFGIIWLEIACVLSWEYRSSRSANDSWKPDRRGVSTLLELARSWPRSKANQVEALFVAAGGQRLDYAGSREVLRLLRSEWSSRPTIIVLFFAPGAGEELLVFEEREYHTGSKNLAEDLAKSLWIPIRRVPRAAIASVCPIGSTPAVKIVAIIGSDLEGRSDATIDPSVLQRVIQLSMEIAMRWSKKQLAEAEPEGDMNQPLV
jgi:hypothetical protein